MPTRNLAARPDCRVARLEDRPQKDSGEAPHTLPPLQCQQLLTLRDELQKHGAAITAANDKRANVRIACPLFRIYIATEAKMLQALDTHGASCGVPAHVNEQVRGSHAKAQQMGKQVCDRVPPQPLYYDAPPFRKDHSGEGMNPIPRREPWPTRLSERR